MIAILRVIGTLLVVSILSGGVAAFYGALALVMHHFGHEGINSENVLSGLTILSQAFIGGTIAAVVQWPVSLLYGTMLVGSQFIMRRSRLMLLAAGLIGGFAVVLLGDIARQPAAGALPISDTQAFIGLCIIGGLTAVSLPWSPLWIWLYPKKKLRR